MVVAGGSGTSADVSARILSHYLTERWGQQVVVENRPGAGGVAGAVSIVQSPPDGYSLLFSQSAPLSLSPHTMKSVPYDVERDFQPIIFVGMVPFVLASNVKLPVNDLAGLVAYARQAPGKVSFATASAGSTPHLAGVLFQRMAGIQMVNVPYVGYPRAIQDTISGVVDTIFANSQIISQQADKLQMLGVTSSRRLADHSDIPAIAELLSGFSIAG
jgi:tripartite-type tricarboxylate transporter receptor subunit TctC